MCKTEAASYPICAAGSKGDWGGRRRRAAAFTRRSGPDHHHTEIAGVDRSVQVVCYGLHRLAMIGAELPAIDNCHDRR